MKKRFSRWWSGLNFEDIKTTLALWSVIYVFAAITALCIWGLYNITYLGCGATPEFQHGSFWLASSALASGFLGFVLVMT